MTVARTQPSGRIGDSASDGYGSCKIILSSGFLCSRPILDTHGDLCDVPGARRDEGDIMAIAHAVDRLTHPIAPATAAQQAYQILHVAFVVAPVVAGLDKFTHLLTNWDRYLAPQVAAMVPAH